jgi:hypothetical protein
MYLITEVVAQNLYDTYKILKNSCKLLQKQDLQEVPKIWRMPMDAPRRKR